MPEGCNPKIGGFELLPAPATRGIHKPRGGRFQAKSSSVFVVQRLETTCFHLIKTSCLVCGRGADSKANGRTHTPLQPISALAFPPADSVILLTPTRWCHFGFLEGKLKGKQVYTTLHYMELMTSCRDNNPFKVVAMNRQDFFDFDVLQNHVTKAGFTGAGFKNGRVFIVNKE